MEQVSKYINLRSVTAVVGVIAAALGWTEQFEMDIVNQVMTAAGAVAMLLGNIFPKNESEA